MMKFGGLDIDAGELVRNLGRLAKLRSRARAIEGQDLGRPLPENHVRVLWPTSRSLPSDLPSVVLGSENTLASFLPKMVALAGALTPITSFMKAWILEDVSERDVFMEMPLSEPAALGFVGLIMGELITTAGPDADLRLMGMDGVRRTLSFVCAQAAMRGWRNTSFSTIVDRWLEVSMLTSNGAKIRTRGPISEMCEFVRILADVRGPEPLSPSSLAHHVQDWVEMRADPNQRDFLQRSLPEISDALRDVTSREQRYDLVMEALNHSQRERHNPLAQGFLISLIEPGSLEFLALAQRADEHGAVATAYCLCAAILGGHAALGAFNGFGWAVLNQGFRLDSDMPMDISIAELRILHHERRKEPIPFRTRSPWLIDVELAPMITGSFGNAAKRKVSPPQGDEDESDATKREERLRDSLKAAMLALENAYNVIQDKRPSEDSKAGTHRRVKR